LPDVPACPAIATSPGSQTDRGLLQLQRDTGAGDDTAPLRDRGADGEGQRRIAAVADARGHRRVSAPGESLADGRGDGVLAIGLVVADEDHAGFGNHPADAVADGESGVMRRLQRLPEPVDQRRVGRRRLLR
jgi:hypothetical protein